MRCCGDLGYGYRVFCDGFAISSEAEAGFEGFCDEFATPSEAEVGFEGFCDEFAAPFEVKLGFDIWVAPWGGWIYMVLHCFVHEEWIPNFQKPHLHGVCLLLFFTHILCFERWASKPHLHGVCLLLSFTLVLHSKRWKHSIWVCIVYAHPIVIRS
jgi:hypothetical protein